MNGADGLEIACARSAIAFSAASSALGAESTQIAIDGRDHFTILSEMARDGDPGRSHMLDFLAQHLGPQS